MHGKDWLSSIISTSDLVHTYFDCSDQSLAVEVRDERNLPLFNIGDLVVIDRDLEPTPGQMILVSFPGKGKPEAILGRLSLSSGRRALKFINPDWGARELPPRGYRYIGTMTEHVRRGAIRPTNSGQL
jgi:SOS-response transcriptional repressor LexA